MHLNNSDLIRRHISTHSERSAEDRAAVSALETFLASDGKINTNFSCDDKLLLLKNYPIIKKIIEDEGFLLNERKTHFHTPSNKKQITGIQKLTA